MRAILQRWHGEVQGDTVRALRDARLGRCHGRGGHSWFVRAALVIIVGVGLAACGGSSHHSATSSSTSGTSSARSRFIARLDSLCNQTNAGYQAAPSVSAATAVIEQYMPRFRALQPPPSLAALYSRYTTVLERELADLKRGQQAVVTRLAQTQARPLALRLGASDCAR